MASRKTKQQMREERRADQARYDEVTRRLKERIERGLAREAEAQRRRASS